MKWANWRNRSYRIRRASILTVILWVLMMAPWWVGESASPGIIHVAYAETDATETAQRREALGKRLADIEELTRQLKITADANVQSAIEGRARCLDSVKAFDEKLGSLYLQREAFDKRGDELKVTLAKTTEQDRNYRAQVEKLRNDVNQAKATLAQLEHNFDLLRKWWWVPGYGQYLSIKTLVNGEIAQYKTIIEELNNSQIQLANYDGLMRAARSMLCEITEERENMSGAIEALQCVQNLIHERGTEFREKTMALADREIFWAKLNDLGSITVEGRRQAIVQLFKAKPSPAIELAITAQAAKLEAALADYQQRLDAGQQFLAEVPADYCTREEYANQCAVQKAGETSSFQASCSDADIAEGQDVLAAQCRKMNGSMQATTVRLRGIHNSDGVLVNTSQGESSFQRSCKDVFICGTTLMASCRMRDGKYKDASVKIEDIHNMDGQLTY